ncbi:hypothetical protein CPB84DRAFT_850966 [Gymnopilus junonius]|uniref:Uncharacterized protein n=1 Tax=Gymnopilus junonius TaxID=109634 RepID=A0A9P5NSU8_GYMJU|nr:hypothetical protein CPB84DRAFT_850966 [Gymnopilus junonius]
MIDTQAPLVLSSQRIVCWSLTSCLYILPGGNMAALLFHTIQEKNIPRTTASFLHERIRFSGQSVYWQHIFQLSRPVFPTSLFIWHAIYAWDEALENLYEHICFLESRVITTSEMPLTQELHVIRAHHLHHTSLLQDLRNASTSCVILPTQLWRHFRPKTGHSILKS